MYAPPPAIVPVAVVTPPPPKNGLLGCAPVLAIGCLLFILLLIAATIILSLIPVYTPRRNANQGLSPTYYVVLTFPQNSTTTDGPLTQDNLNAIARGIERARGLPTGSVVVVSGSLSSSGGTGRRKRRADSAARVRRGPTPFGDQKCYLQIRFSPICPTCRTNVAKKFTNLSFIVTLIFGGIAVIITFTIQTIGLTIIVVPAFIYTTASPNAAIAASTVPPQG